MSCFLDVYTTLAVLSIQCSQLSEDERGGGASKKAKPRLQNGARFSAKHILCNTSEDLATLLRSQLAGALIPSM